jgi:hypothetical protein
MLLLDEIAAASRTQCSILFQGAQAAAAGQSVSPAMLVIVLKTGTPNSNGQIPYVDVAMVGPASSRRSVNPWCRWRFVVPRIRLEVLPPKRQTQTSGCCRRCRRASAPCPYPHS